MHIFKRFLINCGTVGWKIKSGLDLGPRPTNHAKIFPKNIDHDYVYELNKIYIKIYSNLSVNTHQGVTIFELDGMV